MAVKKPIITARQALQFRSSITTQENFQLQNPDRKPPAKVPGAVYQLTSGTLWRRSPPPSSNSRSVPILRSDA
ncbi:hypothetical protein B0H65DRAFT_566893 [Neurospora tetraspora]|uniref:Uncharacterized protein n=1 Tax=Neurospora tetraspora TaxID=94610 RepID=A0AAE0MU54_9PEZI|nr:hypothetical protein B0H65DRAFT_566893 [Neurospora tetraspora]